MNSYSPIIGLEVHVELGTASKMFCGCPAEYFGKPPNSQTCPVCLGMPGALPVPNEKALEWCIKLGLALGCSVPAESKFDRKNYFYPDLPKGYQISQYDKPLCVNGSVTVLDDAGKEKIIRINRVHMEEDTGKLMRQTVDGKSVTLVDFNRSSVPLVEIVTEPDFRSILEVDQYVKKLQQIIRYLGISGADMEKGTMRLEPSISLKLTSDQSSDLPPYRVEIKNINSFRFVRNALEHEIKRQTEMLKKGEKMVQETRGFNNAIGETYSQRRKETADDYRYFPEPDIPPMHFSVAFVEEIRKGIPELPDRKVQRFVYEYGLNERDATVLCDSSESADFFEDCASTGKKDGIAAKTVANWLINKKAEVQGKTPDEIITFIKKQEKDSQIDPESLAKAAEDVIAANPVIVAQIKAGKEQAINALLGQVRAKLGGKGNPQEILRVLKENIIK